MIDPASLRAIAVAVERDLLPAVRHAIAAGLTPSVVAVHRSRDGVAVVLALGSGGVRVEREVPLDPLAVDQRLRLGVLEVAISVLVAEAVRRSAVVKRAPLNVGIP